MAFIQCNKCDSMISEEESFCPKCGAKVVITPNTTKFVVQNPNQSTQYNLHQYSNFKKNNSTLITVSIILGTLLLGGLIAYLLLKDNNNDSYDKYNSDEIKKSNINYTIDTIDESSSAQADTLMRALNDYNYVGDDARIVYASRVTRSNPGSNHIIMGITQGRDFYKVYKLIKINDKWTIDPENIKKISTAGYNVSFDPDKLKAGRDIIPQVVDIDGKYYFFYAYMKTPENNTTTAQVVMNMLDVETRAITTATYEGSFQNVNGEQVIVCNPARSSSKVVIWMNETAHNFINIIHFKD